MFPAAKGKAFPPELKGILTDAQWRTFLDGWAVDVGPWQAEHYGHRAMRIQRKQRRSTVRNAFVLCGWRGEGTWRVIYAWFHILKYVPTYFDNKRSTCLELSLQPEKKRRKTTHG